MKLEHNVSLVKKIKEELKAHQDEHGVLDDKDYEKLFVHFYLMHKDKYLEDSARPIRSDGKKRNRYGSR
jgi:hypothetical protein